MALVTGTISIEGAPEVADTEHLRVRVSTPALEFHRLVPEGEEQVDEIVRVDRVEGAPVERETVLPAAGGHYRIVLPGESVLGSSRAVYELWRWATTWDQWSVRLSWTVAGDTSTVLAVGEWEALVGYERPNSGERDLEDLDPASRVFLVDAAEFRRLAADHPAPGDQDDRGLLDAIRALGVFTTGTARLAVFSDEELAGLAEGLGTTVDLLAVVRERWTALTTFDVVLPAPRPVEVAGTLTVRTPGDAALSRDTFGGYRVSAEMPVRVLDGPPEPFTFETEFGALADPVVMPVPFIAAPDRRPLASAAAGVVTVRVRGADGSVLWRRRYAAGDDALTALDIVVDAPVVAPVGTGTPGAALERRLRGQVVRTSAAQQVAGLTVLVQAKQDASATVWTVVAAGETDGSGYFSTTYPRGDFAAAQAVVSAAPNSVVDLGLVHDGLPDETVSGDFVYLVLRDAGEDVGTGSGRPGRLPDQVDLVRSDEYSQDLGGACVNVTTPNRTLQEYRYTALVRTSDPDVATYTLQRGPDGRYALTGGTGKLTRRPVDLTNPIHWQDAPAAGEAPSFYQAVTVATGHVLTFSSAFKADGYSLGDLVYSLPLAPGQKKQIVSYDVANTLEASEIQGASQAERLAAGLLDERLITDQLGGGLRESVNGSSSATTAGVSAGLGVSASMGYLGGSLGVAGGYANANSEASQSGSRTLTEFFSERLRQSLVQNAEAYRRLNASVVTTVKEGQEYAVTTEVVANHNHCHSLTMMYFEVLRHFVVQQELVGVQEAVFVPLLLAGFTPENVAAWKDVLATRLLPAPSSTLIRPAAERGHPLAGAFDANDRAVDGWVRSGVPAGSYAEEPMRAVEGQLVLRVHFPRPLTRADRVLSLPVITEPVVSRREDTLSTVAGAILTGGLSLLGPQGVPTVELVQTRARLADAFVTMDDNYRSVPPSRCIRIKDFESRTFSVGAVTVTLDFFESNPTDKERWGLYATILGEGTAEQLLNRYFANRLVSEWDGIFTREIAPRLFRATVKALALDPVGAGAGLPLDLTATSDYRGGESRMTLRANGLGATMPPRQGVDQRLKLWITDVSIRGLREFARVDLQSVTLNYTTPHHRGTIISATAGDDLLDETGAELPTPLTPDDLRRPQDEDRWLQQALLDHLNAHLEHYNAALWRALDANRRFMLLDGFTIETFTGTGAAAGHRSLASVVKNELLDVVGNSLVLPVADGYRVDRSTVTLVESEATAEATHDLTERYRPGARILPYRLSVPTRGVYAEAVLGRCDACEEVKPDSSQDWTVFGTDEPTGITPVVTPTPQRTDWKAVWAQFAAPVVAMQTPAALPAPGAGLAGLSDALTKADAFRDLTGLAANQENVIKTYLSNQENAKAFAEMAKAMATQEHNAENSRTIMQSLDSAKKSGALSDDEHRQLVRDHLGRQIDGGVRQDAEMDAEKTKEPSLTNAAIQAAGSDRTVTAWTDGRGAESLHVDGGVEQASFVVEPGTIRPWVDLITYRPTAAVTDALAARDMRVLDIRDALATTTNLDRFAVRITTMPTVDGTTLDAPGLVAALRAGLVGTTPTFLDPSKGYFTAYEDADGTAWAGDDPTGAVLFIGTPIHDDAAVVCSEVGTNRWTFTTVYTERTHNHPVSGHREFGVASIGSGDVVVYTRGADRATGLPEALAEGVAYEKGAELWVSFQRKVAQWVTDHQGKATVLSPVRSSPPWSAISRALAQIAEEPILI